MTLPKAMLLRSDCPGLICCWHDIWLLCIIYHQATCEWSWRFQIANAWSNSRYSYLFEDFLSPGRSIQAWMYSTIWLYLLRLETKDEWWIYWHCVFLFHIVICSHIELLCPLIHVTQLKSRTGLCPQVCLGLVTNRLIITTAATRIPTACHGGKIMKNQQQP